MQSEGEAGNQPPTGFLLGGGRRGEQLVTRGWEVGPGGAVPGSQGSWGRGGLSSRSSRLQHISLLALPAATLATDTSGWPGSPETREKWGCPSSTPSERAPWERLQNPRGEATFRGLKEAVIK